MDLRQLEYFAAVARHRHFTRAAEELYVTQPALSQQIRRLEQELGLALLLRTPSGVELTEAGADLLARAEDILADVERARAAMDEHAGVLRGVVRVAAAAGEPLRLPAELAAFHRGHPGVRITLRQGSAREVVELLRRGAVDLAALALADAEEPVGVDVTELADEPLRLIAAPGDELTAGGRAAVADLRGHPLILAERGTALRDVVMAACAAAGFSPIPPFEIGEPAAVRFLAHSGLGASVVPASWLDAPGPDVGVAVLESPEPRLRRFLLAPAGGLSPAGRLLHEQLRGALS
jgi:DNA-binding transcriptional LysR family regulator